MRRLIRWKRGVLASWALALAGAAAAWAASPVGPAWTADPEEQFLLDVNIRQLRLGDGVRAYATPEGTCIVFGDFLTTLDLPMKIDLAAKKVTKNGSEVHLTPTEWGMLEMLVRNRGKLVGREELLKEVWGPAYAKETHYLRVYLAQLRRKLEDDPSRPVHLLTEAGMGYRFQQ